MCSIFEDILHRYCVIVLIFLKKSLLEETTNVDGVELRGGAGSPLRGMHHPLPAIKISFFSEANQSLSFQKK